MPSPVLVASASLLVAIFVWLRKLRPSSPLPPGPVPIPVLGNIRDLTAKELWLPALQWAKQFGEHIWPIPCHRRSFAAYTHAKLTFSRRNSVTVLVTGDVVYLHVLGQGLVFLNSPEAVFDLLDKRGSIYSDRPQQVMTGKL